MKRLGMRGYRGCQTVLGNMSRGLGTRFISRLEWHACHYLAPLCSHSRPDRESAGAADVTMSSRRVAASFVWRR